MHTLPAPAPGTAVAPVASPAQADTLLHLRGTVRLRLTEYLLEEQDNSGATFASMPARPWPSARSYRLLVPKQHAAAVHAAIDQTVQITGHADGDDARRWAIVVESIAPAAGAAQR